MSLVILRLCLRNPSFVHTKTNLQGNEAIRNAQLDAIKKAFFKIPGTKFFLPEDSPDYSYLRSRVNIYCGKPDLRELEWVNWMPNGAHLFFAPISPVTGKDARHQFQLCKNRCDQYGLDFLRLETACSCVTTGFSF